MTIAEMRICRWCGFPFEGPSDRLPACCNCGQRSHGRDRFSIAASNAKPEDLIASIPSMLAAIQQLRVTVAGLSKDLARLKAKRP